MVKKLETTSEEKKRSRPFLSRHTAREGVGKPSGVDKKKPRGQVGLGEKQRWPGTGRVRGVQRCPANTGSVKRYEKDCSRWGCGRGAGDFVLRADGQQEGP